MNDLAGLGFCGAKAGLIARRPLCVQLPTKDWNNNNHKTKCLALVRRKPSETRAGLLFRKKKSGWQYFRGRTCFIVQMLFGTNQNLCPLYAKETIMLLFGD